MRQDDINKIWELVLTELQKRFSPSAFDLWVPVLSLSELDDVSATLNCSSSFKYGIITRRHIGKIEDAFAAALGYPVKVSIILTDTESQSQTQPQLQSQLQARAANNSINANGNGGQNVGNVRNAIGTGGVNIANTANAANAVNAANTVNAANAATDAGGANSSGGIENIDYNSVRTDDFVYHSEYTFDNFIVGGSNKFAHAACVAVANNPGSAYNPLFIYGPSGLGKTHLMYAVTNEIWRRNPSMSLIYVKGEQFTNELIEAISQRSTSAFREKYRSTDVLLIDDVQFIGGKESTQEEIFHTFNALYESHKQIILTSDRPPKEIKVLEDRLKTRFEWGLLADIQPPDLELRSAIIIKKGEDMGLSLSPEVVAYLSEKLKSNIRQIEGALKRLNALTYLSGEKVTVDVAARSLSDIVSEEEPLSAKIAKVFREVSAKYGFEEAELRGKKRTRELVWARQVAIYILRKKTDMSLPAIGNEFGRDHSTILYSYNLIEREIESNPSFAVEINELLNDIDI